MTVPVAVSVPKTHSVYGEHLLIPVTVTMIHFAVRTCNRFVLNDGRQLHVIKLVGAVRDYHENMKNNTVNVEDGTGFMPVIVWRKEKECNVVLALGHECKGNGYIPVIGEERNYYDMKEIIVFDVCPVSSGNKIACHFLEVAYLFEMMME